MKTPGWVVAVSLVVLALTLVSAGCDTVTPEKIEAWKSTVKGPTKLEEAFRSSGTDPGLRAQAASALYEIGKADVVELGLPSIPADERAALVSAMVPLFVKQLGHQQVERARDARDALYAIRPYVQPAEQSQIDEALLPVVEKDLRAGRSAGGRHSLDKILGAIGPAAGPTLVRLLSDPKVPYPGVVELLGKTADPATREQAGAVLVKRASAGTVPPAMWTALSQVGGKTVVEFLKRKVESGGEGDALAAAQALQNTPKDPSLVPWALRLAGDPKLNKGVRDEIFGLCEHLGGPQVRDGLIRIIASDKEELVRYRAFEAALAAGKAPAIQPALESLPVASTFKKEDIADYLVKDIEKVGVPARPALLKTLSSSSPLARLVAVLALAKLGNAADSSSVEKLAADGGKIKGLPPSDTVGKEATRVAALLKNKMK